jgi:hypothetical protein
MYFDATTGIYRRALAAVELDPVNGWYVVAQSAFVVGLLYEKSTSTTGSIVSIGMVRDFATELANVIDDPAEAGPYYLSMIEPGKLVMQRPAVGIYTLYNRGDGSAHVSPVQKDTLENHIHYRFDLHAEPAGVPNCIQYDDGQKHWIVEPDNTLPGWLPADDPVFNGTAPEGAIFGYNLALHPELLRVWPPQPSDTAYIEVNTHSVEINDSECPRVIVDATGLWWMQNCYGAAPWPPEYPGCISSSSSLSSSSSSDDPCQCLTPLEYVPGHGNERMDQMSIVLWFAKMVAKTDSAVVTSLSPDGDNSPITVLNCEGQPQSTGRLNLGLDLSKLSETYPSPGFKVVKGFDANNILRGPAVTGLKPSSDLSIVGIGTEGEDWELSSGGEYRGDLLIGLRDRTGDPRDYTPNLVSVDSVRDEYDRVNKFFYLHFPGDRASSTRYRVNIPITGLSADPLEAYLWFWFVGRSAGALPQLDASYRRYPEASGTPAVLPTGDTDIVPGGWTPGLSLAAGEYAYAATPVFDIVAGDRIDYTVGWNAAAGPADGFGIMRAEIRVQVKP